MRDTLILRANHEKLKQRILSEPDLTFDKGLQMETAETGTQ